MERGCGRAAFGKADGNSRHCGLPVFLKRIDSENARAFSLTVPLWGRAYRYISLREEVSRVVMLDE